MIYLVKPHLLTGLHKYGQWLVAMSLMPFWPSRSPACDGRSGELECLGFELQLPVQGEVQWAQSQHGLVYSMRTYTQRAFYLIYKQQYYPQRWEQGYLLHQKPLGRKVCLLRLHTMSLQLHDPWPHVRPPVLPSEPNYFPKRLIVFGSKPVCSTWELLTDHCILAEERALTLALQGEY